jgi:TPR repeat protein
VRKDPAKAAELFMILADARHSDGQRCYVMALLDGPGVPRHLTRAAEYFKQGMDQGHSCGAGTDEMGLQHGLGVPRDAVRGIE